MLDKTLLDRLRRRLGITTNRQRKFSHRPRHGRRLGFEEMEGRELLTVDGFGACEVDVDRRGRANVVCDEENNYLNIVEIGDGIYRIDGNGTSINGSDDPVTISGVKRGFFVNFGEGDDMGYFDGRFPSLNVAGIGRLDVQLGGTTGFESNGNVEINTKGFISLFVYNATIGKNLTVDTPGGGEGDLGGIVQIEYTTVDGNLNVDLRRPVTGTNSVLMHHVTVDRNISLESTGGLDASLDWIKAKNAVVTFRGGAGDIELINGEIKNHLQVRFCGTSEAEVSHISIVDTVARRLSIVPCRATGCDEEERDEHSCGPRTDDGIEHVLLSGVVFDSATIRLGSNDDAICIEDSTLRRLKALLDGGFDVVTDGGGNSVGKLLLKGEEVFVVGPCPHVAP